ncbi:hypothetical protein PAXINDRAFT_100962 [Paxillus involutus ATCC 200175]|uniref:Uncharacterized protein n=1 Tax=Paxillus involutus ATCC 200175 TaxID=664439 RepID=A0A0C9TZA6_PAXIN|nr:hypothetical protein PAXINDRAFT_100962 [Paxillus involutus ATCC 200175]
MRSPRASALVLWTGDQSIADRSFRDRGEAVEKRADGRSMTDHSGQLDPTKQCMTT